MIVHELIIGGIGLLTTTVSSLVSWKLARKKYETEVDSNVIKNLEDALKFYEDLTTHNQQKLNELIEENKALRRELNDVRTQLQEITTNLYLNEAYKNRVKTREIQIKNLQENAKNSNRFDQTENTDRGG